MKEFTLFWLNGESEVIKGNSISDAVNKQYSAGAMRALDFYSDGDVRNEYVWNNSEKSWNKI